MQTKQKSSLKIKIEYDNEPYDPRKDNENFGNMICWHSRYNLGDSNDFDTPAEMLRDLVRDTLSADEIIKYAKTANSDEFRFIYDRSAHEWTLQDKFNDKWFTEYTFEPKSLKDSDMTKECILEFMPINSLLELAEKQNVILPLYLYDHSGITMSCSHNYPYNDRWDAGQVGWIYASFDDIKKEFGNTDKDSIDKAENLLIGEVETYDSYLKGECYGFIIEQDGCEVDSCWGFLGDLRERLLDMKENVPDEYQHLFDHIDYGCMEYFEGEEIDEEDDEDM